MADILRNLIRATSSLGINTVLMALLERIEKVQHDGDLHSASVEADLDELKRRERALARALTALLLDLRHGNMPTPEAADQIIREVA